MSVCCAGILLLPWTLGLQSHIKTSHATEFLQAPAEPPSNTSDDDSVRQDHDAIRILVQRCVGCHGPEVQESGLRLDSLEMLTQGGDSGPAIDPSDSVQSLLVKRIQGQEGPRMPPEGERLSADEVKQIIDWIDRGSNWPEDESAQKLATAQSKHWAFQPIRNPEIPSVRQADWPRDQIDTFVLEKLEQAALSPAPDADRRTLIRRLSLDLLGLPPDDAQIAHFVEDRNPDAYEALVDRYLASPQFGERWARHWLDRTQYGETSGCVIDLHRPFAWRWRDWVVDAINRDLPFDRFTIEQIAGDLLPDSNTQTRVATGIFRNALTNHEAGIDLDLERVKTTVDRTSILGSTWLGLTIGCAECHSHKYDPISQQDYYRMYAFMDRVNDVEIDAPSISEFHQESEVRTRLEASVMAYLSTRSNEQLAWESKVKSSNQNWSVADQVDARTLRSLGHATLHPKSDGSFTVDGRIGRSDDHHFTFESGLPSIRAFRVELLPDRDRFHKGPGRCLNGECILTGISLYRISKKGDGELQPVPIASVFADYNKIGYQAEKCLVDTECTKDAGWAVDHQGLSHAAVFSLLEPLDCKDQMISIHLHFLSGEGRTPARFRISVTEDPIADPTVQTVPSDIRAILDEPEVERDRWQKAQLKRYYQTIHQPDHPELKRWNMELATAAKLLQPRGAECIEEGWQTRETHVHIRGDFRRHGVLVEPGIPSCFEKSMSHVDRWTRLELAHWIVSPDNPLTSRVAVNCIWQELFGAGLVRTSGDFGLQGDEPTHPELLDWLAYEWMHSGWSRKSLIRRIVCSSTYRQSSVSPESMTRDPNNVLLGRQTRFRLDGESVRDVILDTAGVLAGGLGGPSYRISGDGNETYLDWEPAVLTPKESGMYRRGIYIAVTRTIPDPMLATFDSPDGATVCPIRQRTNTPIQALTLMNDPIFVDAARALARRYSSGGAETVSQRLRDLWLHCLGRVPSEIELQVLRELYDRVELENRQKNRGAIDNDHIWFVLTRTVLNLDEIVTRP
ncbi:MAG: PSD1 and planctomycete cytochrome C domain-containing protein [Pirellula sp.]